MVAMSGSGFCEDCGGVLGFAGNAHACPPRWECHDVDNDPDADSPHVVHAHYAGEAAEKALEHWSWEDPGWLEPGSHHQVRARPLTESGSAPWVLFWVWYELQPEFAHRKAADEAWVRFKGERMTQREYVNARWAEERVDCTCPPEDAEQGHAPGCPWVDKREQIAERFGSLWAEQGEL